jgi:hypothetical protein
MDGLLIKILEEKIALIEIFNKFNFLFFNILYSFYYFSISH